MRTPRMLAAATLLSLLLAGCAGTDPQSSEPSPTAAAGSPSTPAASTAAPSTASAADSSLGPELTLLWGWVPDDGRTTTPVTGLVSITVDGKPVKYATDASFVSSMANARYNNISVHLAPGSKITLMVSPSSITGRGKADCAILVEGEDVPLSRETGDPTLPTTAQCEATVPAR